jgi:hypothetical protein
MGEMKEILTFCALYSSVIIGALAYTLDPGPLKQKVKVRN